jgi:hypothetical protein
MRSKRFSVLLLVAAGAVFPTLGQVRDYRYPNDRRQTEIPTEGFWPTARMVDLAIDRITDEMSKFYGFDEDQLWNTRDVLKERFPQWMQQNRGELQTLMNQYFEALLAGDPPTPEDVAEWSDRALPLFEEFSQMVDTTAEDMREYMTDEQQVLLNGQLAAMQVGMGFMRQRLQTWREGGYDWESEWPRSHEFKKREGARHRELEAEATRAAEEAMEIVPDGSEAAAVPGAAAPAGERRPTSRPSAPRDEWTIYVDNFIKRYELDAAQQGSARKALNSLLEPRDKYLRRHLKDINAVEGKLKAAQTAEERTKVQAELEQLNRPLERYFDQLKERLDRIPTRKQRAAAADKPPLEPAEKPRTTLKTELDSRARNATRAGAERPESAPVTPAEK